MVVVGSSWKLKEFPIYGSIYPIYGKTLPSHEVDFTWKSVLSDTKETHDSLKILKFAFRSEGPSHDTLNL